MLRRPQPVPSVFASLPLCGALAIPDAFLVQAAQAPFAVVGALERVVGLAVVELVELVLAVERRRVQRLVPVQATDLVLDEAIEISVRLARGQRHGPPEPEVHVHLTGLERIQGPGALAAQAQRAHPYR